MLVFIAKRFGQMLIIMAVVSAVLFAMLEFNIEGVATKVLGQYSTQEAARAVA